MPPSQPAPWGASAPGVLHRRSIKNSRVAGLKSATKTVPELGTRTSELDEVGTSDSSSGVEANVWAPERVWPRLSRPDRATKNSAASPNFEPGSANAKQSQTPPRSTQERGWPSGGRATAHVGGPSAGRRTPKGDVGERRTAGATRSEPRRERDGHGNGGRDCMQRLATHL